MFLLLHRFLSLCTIDPDKHEEYIKKAQPIRNGFLSRSLYLYTTYKCTNVRMCGIQTKLEA